MAACSEEHCGGCRDGAVCGATSGCRWRSTEFGTFGPFLDEEGERQPFACFKGRDQAAVATGFLLLAAGWLMLTWTAGWARRTCGHAEKLRKQGRRVSGLVLGKDVGEKTVLVNGWPVRARVHSVAVEYSTPDATEPRTAHVQVKRSDWEGVEEEIELVYLPGFAHMVEAATVVDAPGNRFGWCTLGVTAVMIAPALLFGGGWTVLDAFHCASRNSCCEDDLPDVNGTLPCTGVGGLSYTDHCLAKCDSSYMMWMMMASMFGLMLSLMIVMFRNSAAAPTSEEEDADADASTRACNFCFGKGAFFSEEDLTMNTIEIVRSTAEQQRRLDASVARSAAVTPGGDGKLVGNMGPYPLHLLDRSLGFHLRSTGAQLAVAHHLGEQVLTEQDHALAIAEDEAAYEEEHSRWLDEQEQEYDWMLEDIPEDQQQQIQQWEEDDHHEHEHEHEHQHEHEHSAEQGQHDPDIHEALATRPSTGSGPHEQLQQRHADDARGLVSVGEPELQPPTDATLQAASRPAAVGAAASGDQGRRGGSAPPTNGHRQREKGNVNGNDGVVRAATTQGREQARRRTGPPAEAGLRRPPRRPSGRVITRTRVVTAAPAAADSAQRR